MRIRDARPTAVVGRTARGATTGRPRRDWYAAMNEVFPDHWSFLLGEIALYPFVVLLLAGTFLALFFTPSTHEVVYHGSYVPLDGIRVSEAYRSTLDLSCDVLGGLPIRQAHHWAANLFVPAIVVHMLRLFVTGAYRRLDRPVDPARGYLVAVALFGGEFPGDLIIERPYIVHVFLIPRGDRRAGRPAPRARGQAQAHPVARTGTHRAQRRGTPHGARVRGPFHGPVPDRLRRDGVPGRAGADQPGVAVGPTRRPWSGRRANPTGT
jgi:hypothetical protein